MVNLNILNELINRFVKQLLLFSCQFSGRGTTMINRASPCFHPGLPPDSNSGRSRGFPQSRNAQTDGPLAPGSRAVARGQRKQGQVIILIYYLPFQNFQLPLHPAEKVQHLNEPGIDRQSPSLAWSCRVPTHIARTRRHRSQVCVKGWHEDSHWPDLISTCPLANLVVI